MSVTPDFIGQIYKDTNTGNLWRANSLTAGDWTLELQNMQVAWTPTNSKLGELIGFFTYGDLAGVTTIRFLGATTTVGFDIESNSIITAIEFPNLVTIDPLDTQDGYIYIYGNSSLASFSAPLLETTNGDINLSSNPSLISADLSSLVPANGQTITFAGCALNQSSVDLILSRCVANAAYLTGAVGLNGGTNSTPSGTAAVAASGEVFSVNTALGGDTITVDGVTLTCGPDFIASANDLAIAITTNTQVNAVAVGNDVTLAAKMPGQSGNARSLTLGGGNTGGMTVTPGGLLTGGSDGIGGGWGDVTTLRARGVTVSIN